MTLREWLDVYTHNGDAQLVCAWRKRAWRAMRPVVERIAADLPAWTVTKALTAIDLAAYDARIKATSKRWMQERSVIKEIFETERALWRAPTDDDRAACLVAIDLVEEHRFAEAVALLKEQAPYVLDRPCRACSASAGWACHEIVGAFENLREDSPQTAALKAGGIRAWSRRSLIVPHEARLLP